jgi:hypothetical protein
MVIDCEELTCKVRALNIAATRNWQTWSESASTLVLQLNVLKVL